MKNLQQVTNAIIGTSIVATATIGYFIYENNKLSISNLEIISNKIPKSFKDFKILHLTDLHGKIFGKNNSKLINKIKELNPDIIVATGDMFSVCMDEKEVFLNLCKNLRNYYPIYYSLGNHETIVKTSTNFNERTWFCYYIDKLKQIGVIVIDNAKVNLVKGQDKINIYGLSLPIKYYRRRFTADRKKKLPVSKQILDNFIGECNKKNFNILLAHNPLHYDAYRAWGSDITFSGHIHGGVVRLPIIKGIFSPEVDFFPKYKEGIYLKENSALVVGRGLGNSSLKVRVLNPPEIVIITLK
ncbi:metallophosphoesterase [Clostridium tarantellae]|uniref:Metallophosphoesterase n=1 Tax=Clostridium tarantellae TaxID=39493 RepID=A0A6I1MUP8_9CLOT|nr:metallophosphoesterase [Clostridium tarantellae]MPQ44561.1 metallophosphoesterase [Clostridium tarantellae]